MQDLIAKIFQETNVFHNPYFISLKDETMTKQEFVETQVQFYFAVIFFSRPMMALAAKIPSPQQRIEILRNIWEEHGEGRLEKSHGQTFEMFLARIDNLTHSQIYQRDLWPQTRILNTTLMGSCSLDDWRVGVGLMGMIEKMFAEISTWIGQAVVQRGWLQQHELIHYTVHEELDIKHSDDFFNILSEPWQKDEESRYLIEQGLRLGATVFSGFYEGLYNARKTKQIRAVPLYLE